MLVVTSFGISQYLRLSTKIRVLITAASSPLPDLSPLCDLHTTLVELMLSMLPFGFANATRLLSAEWTKHMLWLWSKVEKISSWYACMPRGRCYKTCLNHLCGCLLGIVFKLISIHAFVKHRSVLTGSDCLFVESLELQQC